MKKIAFVVPHVIANNAIFDLSDKVLNRDNCHYQFFLLRQRFAQHGFDLSTSDINSIEGSEAALYFNVPEELPSERARGRSFLLFLESKVIRPRNFDVRSHAHFSRIFTNADDLVDNSRYFKINYTVDFPKRLHRDLARRDRLCAMIVANKSRRRPNELYSERKKAIRWFDRHHPEEFDLYGVGWNMYSFPRVRGIRRLNKLLWLRKLVASPPSVFRGSVENKASVLCRYRFTLAFENVYGVPGYISEKLFDAFAAGCVPVYLGAPNIGQHVSAGCFIDRRDFRGYEELYHFMKGVTQREYDGYLDRIEQYFSGDLAKQFSHEYFAETVSREIARQLEEPGAG